MIKTEDVIKFLENSEFTDYNFFFDYHTKYAAVILCLSEAFKGYAYQRDLYDVYLAFYSSKQTNYSTFSKLLTEMQEKGLILSTNSKPKVIYLTSKAYSLLGRNQSTVPKSRINNNSMERCHKVARIHLKMKSNINYHPTLLIQTKGDKNCYLIEGTHIINIIVIVDESKRQGSQGLMSQVLKAFRKNEMQGKKTYLVLVVEDDSKLLQNTISKLKEHSDVRGRSDIVIQFFKTKKTQT